MQMSENDQMLLGIMTSILMTRQRGRGPGGAGLCVRHDDALIHALEVLSIMKLPKKSLSGSITGDRIMELLNDVFPDHPEEPRKSHGTRIRRVPGSGVTEHPRD